MFLELSDLWSKFHLDKYMNKNKKRHISRFFVFCIDNFINQTSPKSVHGQTAFQARECHN